MNMKFNVRTRDNAFSRIDLSVQYRVDEDNAPKASYSLRDPWAQTTSYIENIIRSEVPKMTLTTLFEDNEALCGKVKSNLGDMLKHNGYTLIDTLITSIAPEQAIKDAMTRVRASENLMEASRNEAEAAFVKTVKQAEAEKERKRLQGEGIADQRTAILNGYQRTIQNLTRELSIENKTAIELTLFSQYYDTLRDMASKSNTKTIFVPYSEGQSAKTLESFRNVLLQGKE
jgi:regulator of protease activity HflC (stomatin/prohibitin superfamily)